MGWGRGGGERGRVRGGRGGGGERGGRGGGGGGWLKLQDGA